MPEDATVTVSDRPLTRIRITKAALTAVDITDRPLTRIHIMAEHDIYYVGNIGVFTVSFEVASALTDPTEVTVDVRRYSPLPAGDVTTYTYGVDDALVKVVDGRYALSLELEEAGEYSLFFRGTGAAQGTKAAYFKVLAAPV